MREVVLDGLRAEEHRRRGLPRRLSLGEQPSDLALLRGQLVEGARVAPARRLARRLELDGGLIGPRLAPIRSNTSSAAELFAGADRWRWRRNRAPYTNLVRASSNTSGVRAWSASASSKTAQTRRRREQPAAAERSRTGPRLSLGIGGDFVPGRSPGRLRAGRAGGTPPRAPARGTFDVCDPCVAAPLCEPRGGPPRPSAARARARGRRAPARPRC